MASRAWPVLVHYGSVVNPCRDQSELASEPHHAQELEQSEDAEELQQAQRLPAGLHKRLSLVDKGLTTIL